MLLTRLQWGFGVPGGCLAWFTSYLSGRSYCVVTNGVASHVINVVFGLTGLGSWPVVIILYRADLADIAAQYNLT